MRNDIYNEAMNLWGLDTQLEMVVEECSELIHAIQKYKRNKKKVMPVLEELADVEIMIEQMRVVFGLDINQIKYQKLARLKKRIKMEKK